MSKGIVRFIFDKLVRDRQSAAMQDPRIAMNSRILEHTEFILELKKKLVEESDEVVAASGDELVEELADLTEIIDTLMKACEIKKEAVQAARQKKRDERGGFDKRIFVNYADIPCDSKAYDYCMRQPEKYPIKQK
jgi:predicted house-cleaning noncanonical NTP pyrophosphatase (MazG superfamily)